MTVGSKANSKPLFKHAALPIAKMVRTKEFCITLYIYSLPDNQPVLKGTWFKGVLSEISI